MRPFCWVEENWTFSQLEPAFDYSTNSLTALISYRSFAAYSMIALLAADLLLPLLVPLQMDLCFLEVICSLRKLERCPYSSGPS